MRARARFDKARRIALAACSEAARLRDVLSAKTLSSIQSSFWFVRIRIQSDQGLPIIQKRNLGTPKINVDFAFIKRFNSPARENHSKSSPSRQTKQFNASNSYWKFCGTSSIVPGVISFFGRVHNRDRSNRPSRCNAQSYSEQVQPALRSRFDGRPRAEQRHRYVLPPRSNRSDSTSRLGGNQLSPEY